MDVEPTDPLIPYNLTEEEKKYIYANPDGEIIFTPLYEAYGDLFWQELLDKMSIQSSFEEFRDTRIFERYMANTLQFSAAKSYSEAKLLQDAVFDGQRMRSYREFEKAAQEITDISQKTYLRVEYETAKRNATAASKFSRMQDDADLYPYWVYHGRMDGRERPDHVAMEGKVFRIGDPSGDACFPPNDWNCRCVGDPVDSRYLQEKGVMAATDAEAKDLLEKNVDPQFRYNAAVQGPLPNEHSYFDLFHSANAGDAGMFGIRGIPDKDKGLTGLDSALSMRYIMHTISQWRRDYYVDKNHNIVFQNKATKANVRLSDGVMTRIGKHSRGFQNIPRAITNPDEIWMTWAGADQRVVLRNYILFGSICYMVKTQDGKVTDAFGVSRAQVNKYRRGVVHR